MRFNLTAPLFALALAVAPALAGAQTVAPPAIPAQLPTTLPTALPGVPGNVVLIPQAPPPPRRERRRPMTQRGQTWVPGYWSWSGSQFTWTEGHWESPPRRGLRWLAPRWVRRAAGWAFVPGRWR